MGRLLMLILVAGGGLGWAQERAVGDLKAVCGAFESMDGSVAANVLRELGGNISTPDIEMIRERCAKPQFHFGMFFDEEMGQ